MNIAMDAMLELFDGYSEWKNPAAVTSFFKNILSKNCSNFQMILNLFLHFWHRQQQSILILTLILFLTPLFIQKALLLLFSKVILLFWPFFLFWYLLIF